MESRRKKFKSIPKRKPVGEKIEIETVKSEQNVSGAVENDEKLTDELKRLRAEVASLKKKITILKIINKRSVLLTDKKPGENEESSSGDDAPSPPIYYEKMGPKESNWYGDIPDSDESLEFEMESDSESNSELIHHKPSKFPNRWQRLVNNKPEISWSINHFNRPQNYRKVFTLNDYSMRVYVDPDSPNVRMKLKFDEEAVWLPKPTIIAIIKATQADWVCKKIVERCFTKSDNSNRCFNYKTATMKEAFYSGCVTLDIEIYIELPWTIREIQSKGGVLSWIIENFQDTFKNENCFMKSPEFSAPPTSFRMHAELSSSKNDCLILKVIVGAGEAVDWQTEDYFIVVTVLRPNSDGVKKRIYTKMSRLREGATFKLGKLDDIVDVNSIFTCKVKIIFG